MRILDIFVLIYTIAVSASTIVLYVWGVNDIATYAAVYASMYLILYSLLPPMPKRVESAGNLLSNVFLAVLVIIVIYKVLVALKVVPGT